MKVSFSNLGKHGNLGNQLFQIASTIGIAKSNGLDFVFPKWDYAKYFTGTIPQVDSIQYDHQLQELKQHYHHVSYELDKSKNTDLLGWFQSEKFWKGHEDEIKKLFTWDPNFYKSCRDKYADLFDLPTIAVSVRRGDYVGNPNYYQLPDDYYKINEHVLSDFARCRFLFFSDDIDYCKEHFPGHHYIEGSAIEQLCIMSMCNHFVIANSSFSWWGAYLGEKNGSLVVAPKYWNSGELLRHSNDKDVVPERWFKYSPVDFELTKKPKIDLMDMTFTIPVRFDHQDRVENLALCLKYLTSHFETNIIVTIQDTQTGFDHFLDTIQYFKRQGVKFRYMHYEHSFERTRLLNHMAFEANTPFIANWDCDVFIHPDQILSAVERLRTGKCSGVYPYDGRFLRLHRNYLNRLNDTLDVDMFKGSPFRKFDFVTESFGGAIFWDKTVFVAGGMENENMVNYGPEDFERVHRFKKLGYKIERVKGPLFHLDHCTEENGSKWHEFLEHNHKEFERILSMSQETLWRYVQSWPFRTLRTDPWPCGYIGEFSVDQIYCLNLERRPERKLSASKEFKYNQVQGYYFFNAIDGPVLGLRHPDSRITPGMIGCLESHRAIIYEALKNGLNTIVVFEDDLQFVDGFNMLFKKAIKEIPEDWEFAYLGWTEYSGNFKDGTAVNNYWMVPNAVWGTQAYMVRGRKALLALYRSLFYQQKQIDEHLSAWLPGSGLKYYKIFPSVVTQKFKELGTDVQKQ